MIENERQLLITNSQLKKMKEALTQSIRSKSSLNPKIYKAMISGLKSQIQELEREILEYEKLKKGAPVFINKLEDLPGILIKARIAENLTQKELAGRAHLKSQQIQKYEKEKYKGASFERVVQILKALKINIDQKIQLSRR